MVEGIGSLGLEVDRAKKSRSAFVEKVLLLEDAISYGLIKSPICRWYQYDEYCPLCKERLLKEVIIESVMGYTYWKCGCGYEADFSKDLRV